MVRSLGLIAGEKCNFSAHHGGAVSSMTQQSGFLKRPAED
jgi:hypothetical protein